MTSEVKMELEQKKKDLFLFCMTNKIPVFAVFADETETGTNYTDVVVTPQEVDVKLSDDKITKYSGSLNKHFALRFIAHTQIEDEMDDALDDLLDE